MDEFNRLLLSNPLYWIITIGSIAVIVIIKLYGNKIIGLFGEHWVRKQLNKLPKDKYVIINDLFIIIEDHTHQIDHVIVSKYGIFSIETKQYNGYITGNKYDKKWVRHIGKKKIYYENPIRQNYGHVKALSQLLNIDDSLIYNIVCIPSNAKLKIEHDGELTRNNSITNKILSYDKQVFDNIDTIVDIINKNKIVDKKMKNEHIKNIKDNIINNDVDVCPKCGAKLVQREGKYGAFLGCSNYPKCKFTKNE